MNIYDNDELPNGDNFPVTGGSPLPSDIDDYDDDESGYKFILVGPDDEWVCDLASEFVPDEAGCSTDSPDVWSSDEAANEALACLNYSVKVVKK